MTVYDVATEDGRPWIVMELVRGLSLAEVLDAEGPMAPQRAARIGAEVLGALRSAHAAGVLHRDVKPANVLIANDGRVVLTDFGIATVEGSSALTMTGEVVGSPEFLAPERALGRTPVRSRTCGRWACCCTRRSRATPRSGRTRRCPRCGRSWTRSCRRRAGRARSRR
ncbi:serine/threonine-protein kinase [Streptomyces thermocarboxydus]